MNISQHALVPYSDYVQGYYDAQKQLTATNLTKIRSNKLMPTFGCNRFRFFHFPNYAQNYGTLRIYDPSALSTVTNGTSVRSGTYFSTTRGIQSIPLDVRTVAFCIPDEQLNLLSLNLGNGLTVQDDEII